jgi:hypothetical protein
MVRTLGGEPAQPARSCQSQYPVGTGAGWGRRLLLWEHQTLFLLVMEHAVLKRVAQSAL